MRVWIAVTLAAAGTLATPRAARADVPGVAAPNAVAPSVPAPVGYRVVTASAFGQAISTQKPGARSVRAALMAVVRDLSEFFGSRPVIRSAYEDVRDHRSGGASFTADVRGWPVKGLLLCKLVRKGAAVAAIYGRPDMPPEEWQRLNGTPVHAAGAPPVPGEGGQAQAEDVPVGAEEMPMTWSNSAPAQGGSGTRRSASARAVPTPAHGRLAEYRVPDGTGSVGLAEGWHTDSPSILGVMILLGPADQRVMLNRSFNVLTPNSQMARRQRQFPSATPIYVAPFSTPIEAFRTLMPQMSQMSVQQGGPALEIDNLVQRQELQSRSRNGRSAILSYGITETGPGGRKHYKVLAQVSMAPVAGPGMQSWRYTAISMRAPDATFDGDLPVMEQMALSVREDAQVIMNRARQNVAASQQRYDAKVKQIHEKSRAFDAQREDRARASKTFDAQREDRARASNQRMRQSDDFDEVIRGTRTIEDTRTGERASVDLGDVDRITDRLNESDSGRYREIPLRDEVDPVK